MTQRALPVAFRRVVRISVARGQLLNIVETFLDPLVLVSSLWVTAIAVRGNLRPSYVVLSLVVFSLVFPGSSRLTKSPGRVIRDIVMGWLALAGLLFLFGHASRYIEYFDRNVLIAWLCAAPLSQIGAHLILRAAAPTIRKLQGRPPRAVVAGMNEQGIELGRRLAADLYSNVRVMGFFDDRALDRLEHNDEFKLLGRIADLPAYAKEHGIDVIYLSMPMASQPRILSLLDALRDTTASIYFVPDTFVTDLIQGQMDSVGGIPVVAVCETPFTGLSGIAKRGTDFLLALLILILISPLLLLIAIGIRVTSPGPVVFKQRRYGLDGKEFLVYKFRTMRVLEDGDTITQARADDQRVTTFGAFLRRTSMDELPQFVNVLQGRMSIVGPRPHAVAHNELYRRLIKGYMLRHKVKPGITGWAQVNGYRGETETLEKMKARIDHDLEYLRNWSLRLDLYIIAKTFWVVLKTKDVY